MFYIASEYSIALYQKCCRLGNRLSPVKEDSTLRSIPTCCQDNVICVSFVSDIERTQMGGGFLQR